MIPHDSNHSNHSKDLGCVDSEVFLRNPKTGGFDYTPAQHDYQQHLLEMNARLSARASNWQADDETTLHDSTVYTSCSRRPLLPKQQPQRRQEQAPPTPLFRTAKSRNPLALLSPRSQTSFQRYFHTNATKATSTKAPNAAHSTPPSGGAARATTVPTVTPSPPSQPYDNTASGSKKGGAILQQLRCVLPTTSTSTNTDTPLQINSNSNSHENSQQQARDRLIMNSGSTRQRQGSQYRYREHGSVRSVSTASRMETLPRTGRSSKLSVSSSSLMDNDDDDEFSFLPKTKTSTKPLPSVASSCLDLSFSTVGPTSINSTDNNIYSNINSNSTNNQQQQCTDDSGIWTFAAGSPFCGGRTNNETVDDDAVSVEVSPLRLHMSGSSSGFDADNDQSKEDLQESLIDESLIDPSMLDVAVRHIDGSSMSLESRGAMLLTEAGLKRHNDKKMQQDQVEPLTLRQQNGAGKLEKEVLMQKVERLQAKELQKEADAALEQERADRKRRPKTIIVLNEDGVSGGEDRGASPTLEPLTTPTKHNTLHRPPRTPTSLSPQTSTAPSPANSTPPATKKGSFFKRVFMKKPDAAELKQQWKERERHRVQLARMEKEEVERRERERIESLRRTYLETQRQLEAAATHNVIVDVDEVEPSPQKMVDRTPPSPICKGVVDVDDMPSPIKSEVDVDDLIAEQDDSFFVSSPLGVCFLSSDDDLKESPDHDDEYDLYINDHGSRGSNLTQLSLGPCCVCHQRERTHIAMPCMHFAFCGECVGNRTTCQMCASRNVTFSKINTE
jgi:hypothetical protein